MRDIKFRAWDGDRKEYLSAGRLLIEVRPRIRPVNPLIYLDETQYLADLDRFALEQFTGLLDKNGKEIYEGDVLGNDLTRVPYVVKFSYGEFIAVHNEQTLIPAACFQAREIIGNIHQNPELLEELV